MGEKKPGPGAVPPAPPDPLEQLRDKLLADPNPCVRVCGQISQGYALDHALLLEDIHSNAFQVWLKAADNQLILDKGKRMGLAKYDFERRNAALGLGTRRGQQAALKSARVEFQRWIPETTTDDIEAQIPHGSSTHESELTDEEKKKLLKVASFNDDAGNE